MSQLEKLRAALPNLNERDRNFAESLVRGFERYGSWTTKQATWVNRLIAKAASPAVLPANAANVGSLTGVLALFDRAKQHLKFPAIVLSVPEAGQSIHINVAGPAANVPGSLNVTSNERDGYAGRRSWYGRILRDGTYQPQKIDDELAGKFARRLAQFAADPAGVAAEHGRLTGACCFCNRLLSDERSTAVGYGPICADHYGLPWGAAAPMLAA